MAGDFPNCVLLDGIAASGCDPFRNTCSGLFVVMAVARLHRASERVTEYEMTFARERADTHRWRLQRMLRSVARAAVVALIVGACEAFQLPPEPSPDPVVAHAIEVRASVGLRNDRGWVEAVIASLDSVPWRDIVVTPEELRLLLERDLQDAMRVRAAVGLDATEATVRELLADPTTVWRDGVIPMSPEEALIWDARVDNQAKAEAAIRGYGQRFPEEWSGLYIEPDGTAVALFTDNLQEHRAGIAQLFVPGTVRYEVRSARWSLAQLDSVYRRLSQAWFEERGIRFRGGEILIRENIVAVDLEIPEPRPGIDLEVAEGLDAVGLLLVRAVVRAPWTGGYGSVTVLIVDQLGQPVPEAHCALTPFDPSVVLNDSVSFMTSGEDGTCNAERAQATTYRLEILLDAHSDPVAARDITVPTNDELHERVVVFIPG